VTALGELARLIRSKNAGPFELTFDIMFEGQAVYRRVRDSGAVDGAVVSALYSVPVEHVQIFNCDNAFAIKVSIPRPFVQGGLRDSDGHGGQQYAPLMMIEIPDAA
jgi:hypothetical protein